MKIYEYRAKEILKGYGVPVPKGWVHTYLAEPVILSAVGGPGIVVSIAAVVKLQMAPAVLPPAFFEMIC